MDLVKKPRQKKKCGICGCEFKIKEKRMSAGRLGKVHQECYKDKLIEEYGESVGLLKYNEKLKKEEEKEIIKLEKEKSKISDNKTRDDFFKWIIDTYDINLPNHFYVKISNINNGSHKGLKEGISYEDLLYMFKTKKSELDRIANSKKTKGGGFESNYNRLCFDLAIIVNKYDSYKKWKEKQKTQNVNMEDMKKTQSFLIKTTTTNITNNNDSDDIGDILDEVF